MSFDGSFMLVTYGVHEVTDAVKVKVKVSNTLPPFSL